MEAVCVHRILRSGTSWRCLWTALYAGLLLACPDSVRGESPTAIPEGAAQRRRSEETGLSAVEQDWLRQAEALDALRRGVPRGSAVTTQGDAAGAVDGIKDGKYAFHTNQQPEPWWQVDLGQVQAIARVVVYNRLDYAPGLHNADTLILLTSEDGRTWTPRYDNQGRHFGGISGSTSAGDHLCTGRRLRRGLCGCRFPAHNRSSCIWTKSRSMAQPTRPRTWRSTSPRTRAASASGRLRSSYRRRPAVRFRYPSRKCWSAADNWPRDLTRDGTRHGTL